MSAKKIVKLEKIGLSMYDINTVWMIWISPWAKLPDHAAHNFYDQIAYLVNLHTYQPRFIKSYCTLSVFIEHFTMVLFWMCLNSNKFVHFLFMSCNMNNDVACCPQMRKFIRNSWKSWPSFNSAWTIFGGRKKINTFPYEAQLIIFE